jgi:hypothetical protein
LEETDIALEDTNSSKFPRRDVRPIFTKNKFSPMILPPSLIERAISICDYFAAPDITKHIDFFKAFCLAFAYIPLPANGKAGVKEFDILLGGIFHFLCPLLDTQIFTSWLSPTSEGVSARGRRAIIGAN